MNAKRPLEDRVADLDKKIDFHEKCAIAIAEKIRIHEMYADTLRKKRNAIIAKERYSPSEIRRFLSERNMSLDELLNALKDKGLIEYLAPPCRHS